MGQKKTAIQPNGIDMLNLKKAAVARPDRVAASQCFNWNMAKRGRDACTSPKTRKRPKWLPGRDRWLFGFGGV